MSDPLSTLRSIAAEMTPGEVSLHTQPHNVRSGDGTDHSFFIGEEVAALIALTPHWSVRDLRGLVAAVRLLRFVADPDAERKLAGEVRKLRRLLTTPPPPNDEEIVGCILAALAAAATGGE